MGLASQSEASREPSQGGTAVAAAVAEAPRGTGEPSALWDTVRSIAAGMEEGEGRGGSSGAARGEQECGVWSRDATFLEDAFRRRFGNQVDNKYPYFLEHNIYNSVACEICRTPNPPTPKV